MTEIRNTQGQKYTLQEYLKDHDGMFKIESQIFGDMITGDREYIKGHLRKQFFGACVQGVDVSEYGTVIYLK